MLFFFFSSFGRREEYTFMGAMNDWVRLILVGRMGCMRIVSLGKYKFLYSDYVDFSFVYFVYF